MENSDIPLRRCVTCDSWQPDRKASGFGECTNTNGKCQGWHSPGPEYSIRCSAYTPKVSKRKNRHEKTKIVAVQTQEVALLLEPSHRVPSSGTASQRHSETAREEKKAGNELERNESEAHSVGRPCSQFSPDADRMDTGEIRIIKLEI